MEHLAIMRKSWGLTEKILDGRKKIESRWYSVKYKPWNNIKKGETIYFKNSGGQVKIKAKVGKILQFADLTPKKVKELLNKYGKMENQELHRITSTAIIYKDGPSASSGQAPLIGLGQAGYKYLITKRSPNKKAFPNKWTVPGGGLETDDYASAPPSTSAGQWYYALETSLRREIKEEVNLEVGFVKYLLDLAFIRPDGIPVITFSFYAPYKSGEIKLDDDSVEYAWVTREEAKNYDLIAGIWDEIRMVDEILSGKKEEEVKFK